MIGLDCNQWEMTNFKFGNFDFFSEPTEKCLKNMQRNDANWHTTNKGSIISKPQMTIK